MGGGREFCFGRWGDQSAAGDTGGDLGEDAEAMGE